MTPVGAPIDANEAPVRIEDLVKHFGRQRVLRGITLSFPRGRTTVVLGPSGCGKSVMLKHLVGLLKPDKGRVYYEGERIDMLSERRLAPVRRQFGFLFQQGALFDSMTVAENVAFPLREQSGEPPYDEEARVRYVLRLVGLEQMYDRYPSELSGGQQKRIALARAVVLRPKVVLYDEPTTGLDPINTARINELILTIQRELGITSLVVTHDMGTAFHVANRMCMLGKGRVHMVGKPEEFRATRDPFVRAFVEGTVLDERENAHGLVPH